jgi:tetratricopeptide (TPR) repeat protein
VVIRMGRLVQRLRRLARCLHQRAALNNPFRQALTCLPAFRVAWPRQADAPLGWIAVAALAAGQWGCAGGGSPFARQAAAPSGSSATALGAAAPATSNGYGAGASVQGAAGASGASTAASALSPSAIGASMKGAWTKTTASVSKLGKPKDKANDDRISLSYPPPANDADMYVVVARVREQGGDSDSAHKNYQAALQLDPNYLPALLGEARLYDRDGDLPAAISYYERATAAHPNDATAFNDLGLCYARQQQMDRAAAALGQAVALQPKRDLYRNNLAQVLVDLGRTDEARGHLAAVHGPAVAHFNVGWLMRQRGDLVAARAQLTKALEMDPTLEPARQVLASLGSGTVPGSGYAAGPGPALSNPAPAAAATSPLPGAAPPALQYAQGVEQWNRPTGGPPIVFAPSSARRTPPVAMPRWDGEPDWSPDPSAPPTPDLRHEYPRVDPATAPSVSVDPNRMGRLPPPDRQAAAQSRY